MKEKPVILITGAGGQLAAELQRIASSYPAFEFAALSRQEFPIDQPGEVKRVFAALHPRYCINCAAYTAVDAAETEKEAAYRVNATAAGQLADVCKQTSTRFIHISTDYVFDGQASFPYTEEAPTNPQTVYGASKLEGEQRVLEANRDALIIRTSWVYSRYGKNFLKIMLRLMTERPEVNVVSDQQGSPTHAADLAQAILAIVSSAQWRPGIYHYCNAGVISWYEFATAIRDIAGKKALVHPIPSSDYPTPAKRPAYSALDCSKIARVYGIEREEWKTSLAKCLVTFPV